MKVNELEGPALDWAVAKADQPVYSDKHLIAQLTAGTDGIGNHYEAYSPSTNWEQAGILIDREGITVIRCEDDYGRDRQGFTTSKRIPVWGAALGQHRIEQFYGSQGDNWGALYSIDEDEVIQGPTALIAAMRCYVASKLGEDVDVPEELLEMAPAEQFAEFRVVLAQAHMRTVVGRAAVRWVRNQCGMSLAYLNKRKEQVPEQWTPEHDGFINTLNEFYAEAKELLK